MIIAFAAVIYSLWADPRYKFEKPNKPLAKCSAHLIWPRPYSAANSPEFALEQRFFATSIGLCQVFVKREGTDEHIRSRSTGDHSGVDRISTYQQLMIWSLQKRIIQALA